MNTPSRYVCLECGGEKIKAAAWTKMGGKLVLSPFPVKALLNPISETYAMVCKNCGLTTIYAENPDELTK